MPGNYPAAFVYSDGVPRFPAQAAELLFQIVAFVAARSTFRRGALRGRIFAVYMIAYGTFRFVIEAMRETRKLAFGLSVYQLVSVALVACGVLSFAWYSRRLSRTAR
jgi:prolipoprotein diacylglyceryltransferase